MLVRPHIWETNKVKTKLIKCIVINGERYRTTPLLQALYVNNISNIIIVAFLENATIGYSLESLCACVCVCVSVCFCTITQKEIDLGTGNRNTL